jgi:hypothetical protein
MTKKIMGFKLVTGEEVVGIAQRSPNGQVQIELPLQLRMMSSKIAGSEGGLALVHFPEMSDYENHYPLFLEPLHIVYSYIPYAEVISEYNTIYESKMSGVKGTAPTQIITG